MKSGSERALGRAALTAAMLFVLGAALLSCGSCEHESRESARVGETARCTACHMKEFNAATTPPHAGVRPTSCGVCHTQAAWRSFRVDHSFWPLTGAHARAAADRALVGKEQQVKCFWCHHGDTPTFKGTDGRCIACHREDRDAVPFEAHKSFAETCADCHSTDGWKPTTKPVDVAPPAVEADAGVAPDAAAPVAPTGPPKTPPPVRTPKKPKVAPTSSTAGPDPTTTAAPTTSVAPPALKPLPDVVSRPSRRGGGR